MSNRLNILYVVNSRIPTEKAHGKQIVETCQALADQDCSVLLLLPARVNYIKDSLFDFYRVRQNFTVKRLPCLDLLWLSFSKSFFFFIQSATFTLSAIFFYLWTNKKFNVIYTRDLLLAGLLSFGRRPTFVEIHDLPAGSTFFHRMIWKRAKGLIVISRGLQEELIRQGVSENKILISRDGVRLEEFDISISKEEARLRLNLDPYKKIVLYTGHLYDWKGADLLAEASASLPLDVQVYVVGGTVEDVSSFKERFNSPNLFITGYHPPSEIPMWLKAADLLVLPNRADKKISSHYTSPLKLFEYMASNTPIIVSDLPSLREVVTENEVFFFEPDHPQNLVRVILTILSEPNLYLQRGSNARNIAEKYTWNKRGEQITRWLLMFPQKDTI